MRKSLLIVYGLFVISLSILGTLSLIFYNRYSEYIQYANMVEGTYDRITQLNRLTTHLKNIEAGQRGFLLTRDSTFLEPYLAGVDQIKLTYMKLDQAITGKKSQQRRLYELNLKIQDELKFMDHTRLMFMVNSKEYRSNMVITNSKMDECIAIVEQMEREELQLLGMQQETKILNQTSTPEYLKAVFSFSAFTFIISFILILREFRGRVKYQNELEQNLQELNQSNMELEQIAYVASHDLQEPLRKINTFSDRLVSKHAEQLNEEGKHIINRMSYASSRMRDLIEDLANYTNLVKRNEVKRNVDLNVVVDTVIRQFNTEIAEKGANITFDSLPTIKGYSQQLLLLFEALISNGLKFSQDHLPPLIIISSSQATAEEFNFMKGKNISGRFVKITVKDNGIGFDNEFAEKVFGIFQRLHNQHSEYGGKGVGLAIVKRVMANHKGYVFAKGRMLEGAEFTLLFPAE
jgi:signal transduction histidine kinase